MLLIVIVFITVSSVGVAHANPQFFARSAQSASATSSPTTIQNADATSTLFVYDSYNLANGSTVFTKPQDSVLLLQTAATSTTPVLNVTREYSQDGGSQDCTVNQLACDWYSDNLMSTVASTPGVSINLANMFTVTGTNGTTTKITSVATPTRYVRIRIKAVGGPMTVWGQLIPNKEIAQ